MLDSILYFTRKLIPGPVFRFFQPAYHSFLAFLSALWYRFPSRHIKVIAVTGTKGKSSTTEIVNAILEEAGYKTALSNTIRFKIGTKSRENLYKMSMPGRFFIQRFLRRAVQAGCQYVIMEATSQGALFKRHAFISFDALIFTNIAPEHIEAHGSFENYVQAKLSIAKAVANSSKGAIFVGNTDDVQYPRFAALPWKVIRPYSLSDGKPYNIFREGLAFTYEGNLIRSPLSGEFNLANILAAITFARTQDVSVDMCQKAIENFSMIPGRVQKIDEGQDFTVVVDYAHTPDSLQKLYDLYRGTRKIAVLGNTGGGRDTWKRDEMARIAETECDEIILTNEDPYDDDPMKIVTDMAGAMKEKKPHIVMDRREAIRFAFSLARPGDSVLITGKGTDPYIMGPDNSRIPWSDAEVTREELRRLTTSYDSATV
ncbi:MAG TPA: UDP-N-acetylmuramyl-tripeptide synthetase [Candidatus Paceibacterota bacterium]|jgi:UDP-N-acetylmuramyl-tripeptide synthetase